MKRSAAIVLRAPGTNCEMETAWALTRVLRTTSRVTPDVLSVVGAGLAPARRIRAEIVPLARALADPGRLASARLVAIPGGFSFRDEGGPGRRFGEALAGPRLGPALRALVERGGVMLGICNGFQALVAAGWFGDGLRFAPNGSGRFQCEWVRVEGGPGWPASAEGTGPPAPFLLPIAHGEGRLVASADTVARLEREGRIILRYVDNPDGSVGDIAGLSDSTGRVIGIMPHLERYVLRDQVPGRAEAGPAGGEPAGLRLLRAIISGIR